MFVKRVRFINFQQFGDLDIKLTYPKEHVHANRPLDKVCFIGRNGTGKTTILNWLRYFYQEALNYNTTFPAFIKGDEIKRGLIAFELSYQDETFIVFYAYSYKFVCKPDEFETFINTCFKKNIYFSQNDLNEFTVVIESFKSNENIDCRVEWQSNFSKLLRNIRTNESAKEKVIIFSPFDGTHYYNDNNRLENFDIDQLNKTYNKLPLYHDVSFKKIENVFKLITYEMQRRIEKRQEFEEAPENIKKSKEILIDEFEKLYPDIIELLSEKWDIILESEGLEIDREKTKKPTEFIANINNFIKSKSNNETIDTLKLSSGTLSVILRLGYLTTLFHNKKIQQGIALFDEPENSLFPDVLYNIIDAYISTTKNTQFFFATHSPIIAAQFEPEERVILEFNENHQVYAEIGKAPLGDDPNDLLRKDFGRDEVMTDKGVEKWKEYLKMRRQYRTEKIAAKKDELFNNMMILHNKYGFPYEENS